jgi:uncharacterized membrane protein (UPF0127 family)
MRLLLILLPLALLPAACQDESPQPQAAAEETIPFRKDGTLQFLRDGAAITAIAIEIAATDSARTRGLMQRTSLPTNSGMLFIFEQEEPQGFWMANTPLALDLFFVDADSQIVKVAKYTRPLSPETVASEAPAQYVIEVPAGFADAHGIIESDRVRWRR